MNGPPSEGLPSLNHRRVDIGQQSDSANRSSRALVKEAFPKR